VPCGKDGDRSTLFNCSGQAPPPSGRIELRIISVRTTVLNLIRQSIAGWVDDRAATMGAALAFYGAFSLAPMLVLVTALAGTLFGVDAVRGAVIEQARSVIGREGALALGELVSAAYRSEAGLLASLLAIGALVLGATSLLVELQDDLDIIWRAPARPGSGLATALRARAVSLIIILAMGILLLATLVVTAGLTAVSERALQVLGDATLLLFQLANGALSLGIATLVFALLYKAIPNVSIAWRDVWVGALVTGVLFVAGHVGIGLYLKYAAIGSAYGAAGTFVVLLLWLYYSAQIFLLGAEFTSAYARSHGSQSGSVEPIPHLSRKA
jgi:membrane protein